MPACRACHPPASPAMPAVSAAPAVPAMPASCYLWGSPYSHYAACHAAGSDPSRTHLSPHPSPHHCPRQRYLSTRNSHRVRNSPQCKTETFPSLAHTTSCSHSLHLQWPTALPAGQPLHAQPLFSTLRPRNLSLAFMPRRNTSDVQVAPSQQPVLTSTSHHPPHTKGANLSPPSNTPVFLFSLLPTRRPPRSPLHWLHSSHPHLHFTNSLLLSATRAAHSTSPPPLVDAGGHRVAPIASSVAPSPPSTSRPLPLLAALRAFPPSDSFPIRSWLCAQPTPPRSKIPQHDRCRDAGCWSCACEPRQLL